MTELSYSISDIQTRIFEIQELRHKSQSSSDMASTTGVIDQSLMTLDERLESVAEGIKTVNASMEQFLLASPEQGDARTILVRKHAALLSEWESVQDESDVLREELKEDKWLTVFRTVTDQADGMMSSLEKAVNRCQEFIWQVHKCGIDAALQSQPLLTSTFYASSSSINMDVFNSLLDSFEAKKKHYMPATSKVLSIIDKGVRDRVTKNGETLRRHAESAQRWKNLRERIARTDAEMEGVRKILMEGDSTASSEGPSSISQAGKEQGSLATPPSHTRHQRSANTVSRSISPLRKFARKLTGASVTVRHSPVTPLNVQKNKQPSSEPSRWTRGSIFGAFMSKEPTTPVKPGHKHSQSMSVECSPGDGQRVESRATFTITHNGGRTLKSRPPITQKQPWNSSTKLRNDDERAVKATPPKRAPSVAGMYGDPYGSVSPGSQQKRSLSRTSMASSRPWSPVTSSATSTSYSSTVPLPLTQPVFRPPSRARAPSGTLPPRAPSRSAATPRPRPKTPSQIPTPSRSISGARSDANWGDGEDDWVSVGKQRPDSPGFSSPGTSPSRRQLPPRPPSRNYPPRPPSRSMIPLPSVQLSSASRPSTSMSSYGRESPSPFRNMAARAQTPEFALRARAQRVPIYQGTVGRAGGAGRPSLAASLPPSSFRDTAGSRVSSRPSSRSGAFTPSEHLPFHEYVPVNPRDPLDAEVAEIANSIAHGLLVERIDPPLRKIPKEGEEIKAQYAFSNALGRKVVTCRLTTLMRSSRFASGDPTVMKKVMVRVGGGWQDLHFYMLNRQAGM
ncbi:hypothetical protein FISHEDRAFT_65078 [Fistulina hepatica ATCC 64428]|uniref:GAR domain-containing protein n=1 Tax=Fistulina hepatica ATCC 64428 TaxID=1128425 RepID=A0A0D7AF21_9AGAR|nr:hypothetical protein FISHEDRAFT_65078 [Fistulina hepatica ATCC 64428]